MTKTPNPAESPALAQILERSYSDETLAVDEENAIIRNVRILGAQSANNREYSQQAQEDAVRLYDGADVFIDHRRRGDQADRGLAEGVGVIQAPRRIAEKNEVRGDLHYFKHHPAASVIVERAQRFPRTFGLSHDAAGEIAGGRGKNGGDLVERLVRVNSVDLVRKPATNKGLFEDERATTVRELATKHVGLDEGKRLAALLEADGAMMADTPVTVEIGMTGDQEITKAFEAMLLAVFRSTQTPQAKLSQIRAILNIQGDVEAAPTREDQNVEKTVTPPAVEPAKLSEDDRKRLDRLELAERRQLARDLVEQDGRRWLDLDDKQRKLLEAATDEAAMKSLLETWPKKAEPSKPAPNAPRPKIGSALTESIDPGQGKYSELKAQIRPKAVSAR